MDQAVTAIATEWKLSEFLQRASPELLATVNGQDIDRVFATLQVKFGKLKQYTGAKGAARLPWHAGGETVVAQYVATAEFEERQRGHGAFRVLLENAAPCSWPTGFREAAASRR